MTEDLEKKIAKLERENRIVKKKLDRSESSRATLEESKDRFDKLYQKVIEEVEEQKGLLRQREQQFRLLLESAPDATIIVGEDGRIKRVNLQAEKLLGYSREDMLEEPVEMLVPEGLRAEHPSHCRSFFNDQEARSMGAGKCLAAVTRSGEELPVEISLSPIQTDQETFVYCAVRDISERMRMEDELRRNEANFRAAFSSAAVGIVTTDPAGHFTRTNDTFLQFVGYTWEELKERNLDEILHKDFASHARELIQEMALGNREAVQLEERFVRKDGEERWADLRSSPIGDEQGECIALVTTVSDITNRMQTEKEQARRMRGERAMASLSRTLLGSGIDSRSLTTALGFLVSAMQVDRIGLFKNIEYPEQGLCAQFAFESCAPGVEERIHRDALQTIPYDTGFDEWRKALQQGHPVMTTIEDASDEQQETLRQLEVLSLLAVPLKVGGGWYGYVCAGDSFLRRDWSGSEITMMQTAAEIIGAFLDRQLVQEAMRASEKRLQDILDTSPVGVAFSTKGKIHFANPRFLEMFGVGAGDPSPNLYVNPEERDLLVRRLNADGRVENHELQMFNRHGAIREMLITYLSIEHEGEQGILGWLMDITERKQAERKLKQKFDELARFRRLAFGRENKMIELKKEINALLENAGKAAKYKIHVQDRSK